jgi:hypothetical protein
MSNTGPNLRSRSLWARHEAHFLAATRRALDILRLNAPHPADEVSLNRRLYFALLEANRELDPKGKYPPPVQEACNQPDPDDITRATRERKIPDFQWGFTDPHEPNVDQSAKQFLIECKRLGASGTKWVLNENYANHGVLRFVDPAWGYAQRFPSALMIGYWQNMTAPTILLEVNKAAALKSIPALQLSPVGWLPNGVSELAHTLTRTFPISPFNLSHWWVDLR